MASVILEMTIHLAQKAQIALFITKKVTIPVLYLDYVNVFSKKLAKVLSKYTGINKYAIKLENIK